VQSIASVITGPGQPQRAPVDCSADELDDLPHTMWLLRSHGRSSWSQATSRARSA